jgi:hypothetical protein
VGAIDDIPEGNGFFRGIPPGEKNEVLFFHFGHRFSFPHSAKVKWDADLRRLTRKLQKFVKAQGIVPLSEEVLRLFEIIGVPFLRTSAKICVL